MASTELQKLPSDVLFLITEQLGRDEDFNTLLNCALASRDFAIGALLHLWRIHQNAPITHTGIKQADLDISSPTIGAWINLWRSLILSSLNETYQPYCHFVRVLDLDDLRKLLELLSSLSQERKRGSRGKRNDFHAAFFEGRVNSFFFADKRPTAGSILPLKMDVTTTLEQIGDRLTIDTPKLEELILDVNSGALQRWIPRLCHLYEIRCWDGRTIENTGELLAQSCPHFSSLRFYSWVTEDADPGLARFLRGLRPNTLQHLEVFSRSHIADEVAAALEDHKRSLMSLKTDKLQSRTFLSHLPHIGLCTSLSTLKLDGVPGEYDSGSAEAMSLFLQRCTCLRDLTIINTWNAPVILTPLVASSDAHLERLHVERYNAGSTGAASAEDAANTINIFHSALTHQSGSLRRLVLNCEGELCDPHRLAIAASELVKLTELRVLGVSDYFVTDDIFKICSNLTQLEELAISGESIENTVWTLAEGFRALPGLRKLDFHAFSAPTFEALHHYIDDLRVDRQQGMALNMYVDHCVTLVQISGA